MTVQVVTLKQSPSGDGAALAEAQGKVVELEGKLSGMEKQYAVAVAACYLTAELAFLCLFQAPLQL